jgi:hypothetical protein
MEINHRKILLEKITNKSYPVGYVQIKTSESQIVLCDSGDKFISNQLISIIKFPWKMDEPSLKNIRNVILNGFIDEFNL